MPYYVWGIFNYVYPAPRSTEIHKSNKDNCLFYPFKHDGSIFTIDSMLWRSGNEIFAPKIKDIEDEIFSDKRGNIVSLMATLSYKKTMNADCNNQHSLEPIPKNMLSNFLLSYDRIGIDIIDFMGISGLANMGYSSFQADHLNKLNIEINNFGLVCKFKQAKILTNILSTFVPEHSPFISVEIWKRSDNRRCSDAAEEL